MRKIKVDDIYKGKLIKGDEFDYSEAASSLRISNIEIDEILFLNEILIIQQNEIESLQFINCQLEEIQIEDSVAYSFLEFINCRVNKIEFDLENDPMIVYFEGKSTEVEDFIFLSGFETEIVIYDGKFGQIQIDNIIKHFSIYSCNIKSIEITDILYTKENEKKVNNHSRFKINNTVENRIDCKIENLDISVDNIVDLSIENALINNILIEGKINHGSFFSIEDIDSC